MRLKKYYFKILCLLALFIVSAGVKGCDGNVLSGRESSVVDDGFDNDTITGPSIINITITSSDGDADSWYEDSDTVIISAEFGEVVNVNTASGTPTLNVNLSSGSKAATYTLGSGSTTLSFSLAISTGDEQCSGVLPLGGISLNGGTIKNTKGTDAVLSVSSVSGAQIDAAAPTISTINVSANDAMDDRINDEAVTSSWTKSDSCGVATTELAMGLHNGTTCTTPESTLNFVDIANVNSIKPISGTAPFNTTNIFNINSSQDYCTSIRVTDNAGNANTVSSAAWGTYYPDNTTDIVAWFDMSNPLTLKTNTGCTTDASDTDSVNCVLDRSPEGNNIISFGGTVPTYVESNQALNFINRGLRSAADASLNFATDDEYTYFVVAQSNANGTFQVPLSTRSGENGFYIYRIPASDLTTNVKWPSGLSGWNVRFIKLGYANADFIAMDSVDGGVSRTSSFDGVETVDPVIAGVHNTTNIISIGSHANGTFPWNGRIYEAIVFSRALTAPERLQVYSYLNNKWN